MLMNPWVKQERRSEPVKLIKALCFIVVYRLIICCVSLSVVFEFRFYKFSCIVYTYKFDKIILSNADYLYICLTLQELFSLLFCCFTDL